ncbi:MAG: peptidoglycan recognition family protein [Candidatus Competibacter sp.]|nr:peptidoglycan recognition family protein [Candidatus Competibacter sp.]
MDFLFFQPTQLKSRDPAHAPFAVFGAALAELVIRPGTTAQVGLWGKGYNGDLLEVRVYRGGARVSGSPSSPVKFTRTASDPKLHLQEFQVTGLREGDTLIGVTASGQPRTEALPVYELRNTPSGLMRQAANESKLLRWSIPGICPDAIPYLAIQNPKMGAMPVLKDLIVKPLMNVRGLAIHTTAGTAARSPYVMARWGCVEPWNSHNVNAHFGVAGDGTLVQFVPTTFVAYAQYSPGNEHWISVEVDNDGKTPMNTLQLASVRLLFRWVANTYGVPHQVATGCLFPKASHFDRITTEVCGRGDAETTTDPYMACMSRGVSCHWWLEATKTNGSHGCPGPGILNQLDAVARGL